MKNEITAKRLAMAMSKNNMKAQELADRTGVNKSSISQYINGTHTPGDLSAIKMAKVLGVHYLWLQGHDVPMDVNSISQFDNIDSSKTFSMPLLGPIACGEPSLMPDGITVNEAANVPICADFALIAKGDSMIDARIHDGDVVFIRKQPVVQNGQIAAVAIDDEATLKRFYKYEGLIVLRACNPAYKDIEIRPEDGKTVSVLGLAVAFQSAVR